MPVTPGDGDPGRMPSSDPYAVHRAGALAVCPACSAVLLDGRWRSVEREPRGASALLCPACRRSRDGAPAGMLTLEGDFVRDRRTEILALVRQVALGEREEDPMRRIMAIEKPGPSIVVIQTTDIELPRRIGRELQRAYGGRCTFAFAEDTYQLRGHWSRG